jgi:hypothetical protein
MAEYEAPNSTPDRVVKVAANSGLGDDVDNNIVKYAKATIQSGDGPFRHVMHPFLQQGKEIIPQEAHAGAINGAVQALEADPNWGPYIKTAPARAPGRHDWLFDPEQQQERVRQLERERAAKLLRHMAGWFEVATYEPEDKHLKPPPRSCRYCGHKQTGDEHGGVCEKCGQAMVSAGDDGGGAKTDGEYSYDGSSDHGKGKDVHPSEDKDKDGDSHKHADWHEAGPMMQFQQERGDFAGDTGGNQGTTVCPNCGTMNQPGATKCAKCGAKIGLEHPSMSGGPSNAYSNPYTGNPVTTHTVMSEMSKWHLADLAAQAPGIQAQPDTVDGPFNDHRDVSEMSPEQSVGHERLVNIVVDEMNKAISGGAAVDATLVQNLVQWLVDKFGQDADSAQAIVDAATKQSQTSDGRLDSPVVPDPAEQAIQPNQGDVVSDPSQTQNQGAFSHVRTPSGKIGHVIDTWEDMYSEKWAMVATSDGARESVYADELEETSSPDPENAVEELQAFIKEMEPVEARVSSIKARIANMRILKQEIRRHMTNPRLSMEQRFALDQMDADASVEMLALTDAVPSLSDSEQSYLDAQPRHQQGFAEDQQPTMFGASEIDMPEAAEPEWTNEALDAYLPEEAEILVSELPSEVRSDAGELAAVAAAHVDVLTAGHPAEVRAHHRDRFVAAAATVAADYATSDGADTLDPDTQDWDGPADAIFAEGL